MHILKILVRSISSAAEQLKHSSYCFRGISVRVINIRVARSYDVLAQCGAPPVADVALHVQYSTV